MKNYKGLIKILVILTLLVAVSSVAWVFLFRVLKEKNQNVSTLSSYLSSEVSREGYVVSTNRLLQSLDDDISKIKNSIISKSGDVEFIENLEFVAKGNGLSINIDSIVLENDPKNASTTISVLRIKAKTIGSWIDTYKFIAQLESLPYKIKLSSLSLSHVAGDASSFSKTPTKLKSSWATSFEIRVLKYK